MINYEYFSVARSKEKSDSSLISQSSGFDAGGLRKGKEICIFLSFLIFNWLNWF
jgi:hypothetical protein